MGVGRGLINYTRVVRMGFTGKRCKMRCGGHVDGRCTAGACSRRSVASPVASPWRQGSRRQGHTQGCARTHVEALDDTANLVLVHLQPERAEGGYQLVGVKAAVAILIKSNHQLDVAHERGKLR